MRNFQYVARAHTQLHNLCAVPACATPSRFKLRRRIIRFASVRSAQYLVKRSTADKGRDTLTARLQSAPIIRRCYVGRKRHGLERGRKAGAGRKSRGGVDISYARYAAITFVGCEISRIYRRLKGSAIISQWRRRYREFTNIHVEASMSISVERSETQIALRLLFTVDEFSRASSRSLRYFVRHCTVVDIFGSQSRSDYTFSPPRGRY